MPVGVHLKITVAAQYADGAAHAGFGKAHIVRHIERADASLLLRQDEDSLKIHLSRFLNFDRLIHSLFSFRALPERT